MGRVCRMVAGVLALAAATGCSNEERGPLLAGGREVKSWVAELRSPQPKVRRQAVLKLGNVGAADPAAVAGLAEALGDADALVRREAILGVAKLTSPTDQIKAKLEALVQNDRDATVRDYAQKALNRFQQGR